MSRNPTFWRFVGLRDSYGALRYRLTQPTISLCDSGTLREKKNVIHLPKNHFINLDHDHVHSHKVHE